MQRVRFGKALSDSLDKLVANVSSNVGGMRGIVLCDSSSATLTCWLWIEIKFIIETAFI